MGAPSLATSDQQSAPVRPRSLAKRLVRRTVGILLALVSVALVLRITGLMDRYFFFPSREPFVTPPGVEDVEFTTADGPRLHGWFVPAPGSSAAHPAPAVLHVHGNAGNVSFHTQLDFLAARGFSLLTFDYRGYGRSQAVRGSRTAYLADARAAWSYLLARPDVDTNRCAVIGVSIGATFAAALAAERHDARALVLASPFATWRGIAHTHAPVLGPLLVRPGLDPADSVRSLGARELLVVHGERDDIIPISHGRRVHEAAVAAGVPARFLPIQDAGHNDLMDHGEAVEGVVAFLNSALRQAMK